MAFYGWLLSEHVVKAPSMLQQVSKCHSFVLPDDIPSHEIVWILCTHHELMGTGVFSSGNYDD